MDSNDLEQLLDACFVAKKITETLPALPQGMKPRHIHVLHAVFELQTATGGCRVSDVSRALNITMPSITKLVQELTDRRLLTKYCEAEDKRVTLLTLTDAGNVCVEQYVIAFHRAWAAKLETITPEQVRQAVELIAALRDAMPGLEGTAHETK